MTKSNDLRYTCKRCGRRTGNYSEYVYGRGEDKAGESYCDECIDEMLAIADWENEQWHRDEITCPWCGYKDPDSWEFDGEYDDEYECSHCGKPFIVKRIVDVTYTSKRRIEDMPKGFGTDGEQQRDGVFDDH